MQDADGDNAMTLLTTVMYVTCGLIAVTAIVMIIISLRVYHKHTG